MDKKHVGITGFNASGKGEVARYFQKQGYILISLSDLLREEAKSRNIEFTRENLTKLGKELRKQRNPGFLAELAVAKTDPSSAYVIDSIRHPEEIRILKEKFAPFFLLGIDAPIEVRFERSRLRGRQENADTIAEFIHRENQEKKNNPNAQQLHKCMEMCDALIINDSDIQSLEKKIKTALSSDNQ